MSSYPGGKSGAGIYQRLINLIPRHRILIVPFAQYKMNLRMTTSAETAAIKEIEKAASSIRADS